MEAVASRKLVKRVINEKFSYNGSGELELLSQIVECMWQTKHGEIHKETKEYVQPKYVCSSCLVRLDEDNSWVRCKSCGKILCLECVRFFTDKSGNNSPLCLQHYRSQKRISAQPKFTQAIR